MNWAPYAVYNPQLWHWPETWPLVSLSPTVEPFIVIGYATFYMAPFFPAVWILRRLQARRPVESFVWRHPLLSLSALILADRVRVRRVPRDLPRPHPAVHLLAGDPVRARSRRASGTSSRSSGSRRWSSTVMIPAGVLLYRDDTGRTQAEKLAQRVRVLPRPSGARHVPRDVRHRERRATSSSTAAGSPLIRRSPGPRPSVACPWPYPEAKVYDPQRLLRGGRPARARTSPASGPGGRARQPDGRPDVEPPADGGRCGGGGG